MVPGAISSAVERLPYKQDVAGSKPASPISKTYSSTRVLGLELGACDDLSGRVRSILRTILRTMESFPRLPA